MTRSFAAPPNPAPAQPSAWRKSNPGGNSRHNANVAMYPNYINPSHQASRQTAANGPEIGNVFPTVIHVPSLRALHKLVATVRW